MHTYQCYVYAYLNEDNIPYYIGKGKNRRAFAAHRVQLPIEQSKIIFLEKNLSEIGALAIERRMIEWYGRIDLGTGILHNRTNGGDGGGGDSVETRLKKSRPGKLNGMWGRTHTQEVKEKLAIQSRENLKGKSYKDLYGVEKAKQLKKERSVKLKEYLKSNPTARVGENNSNSKTYYFIDPVGNKHVVTGQLKNFCKLHCLDVGIVINCAKGRRESYKGWLVSITY